MVKFAVPQDGAVHGPGKVTDEVTDAVLNPYYMGLLHLAMPSGSISCTIKGKARKDFPFFIKSH